MHKPPNDYFYWPLTSYTEPTTSGVRVTTSWKDGTYADQGRGYMMFLAEQVNPPSFTSPGLVSFTKTVGSDGASVTGSSLGDAALVLNWESSGQTTEKGYFTNAGKPKQSVFNADLSQEIGVYGVPAYVAVNTATLPNWAGHSVPHAIAVVGYDASNYYYVDTCWKSTRCGYGNPTLTGTRPGTWAISKSTLYGALIGYIKDSGYYARTEIR